MKIPGQFSTQIYSAVSVRASLFGALAMAMLPAVAEAGIEAGRDRPDALVIAGTVTGGLRLAWQLDYVATHPVPACQVSDDVAGMTIPRSQSEYQPVAVQAGRYEAHIVLTRDAEGECGWALRTVHACIAKADTPNSSPGNCIPMLIAGPGVAREATDLLIDCENAQECNIVNPDFAAMSFEGSERAIKLSFIQK